jgi:hypothetical protein
MKIRWTRDGVRLRITPTELEDLQRGAEVVETLSLPGGSWSATIRPGAPDTSLILEGSTLCLTLNDVDLAQLSTPEAEGVYFQTSDEPPLRYFIEKDFPCAHPRATDALEPVTESFEPPPDFLKRKG